MAITLDTPWAGISYSPATPLDIATLENAIVSQLAAQITGIEVAHFPDRPDAYRMTHRVGAALVRYQGATYGQVNDVAAVVQERKVDFEVLILMRDLGWSVGGAADGPSPGAYAMMEMVRATLTGFQIPGCTKMRPLRERFVERDKQGGVWVYSLTFGFSTVAIEAPGAIAYPLFTKGVAQEQGGVTAITLAPALYTFGSGGSIELPNRNVFALVVSNPNSGAVYVAGVDYSLDGVNGIITAISGGSISAQAAVMVAYSYAETVTAIADGQLTPTAPSN
ncbi:MAG: Gp37 family protein [Candidatus Binataceae bacterium]